MTATRPSSEPAEIPHPIERRLRSLLGLIALSATPPLLALWVVAHTPGLHETAALDFAQLARRIADGHGFATLVLRPLSLGVCSDTVRHPDLVNAPLWPLLLSEMFRLTGGTEAGATALGVLLWLVLVWSVFALARFWWNARVAGLATAFCVCGTTAMLMATGLPFPLLGLLVLAVVLCVSPTPSQQREARFQLPWWRALLAGVFCALAALTDYRFGLLVLAVAAWLAVTQKHRGGTLTALAAGFVLILLPWGWHNVRWSGRLFGLFAYSALENTRAFPGETIWRLLEAPSDPWLFLLTHPLELARKLALSLAQHRSTGLGWAEPVTLFLSAVALFSQPRPNSRRRLAWLAVAGASAVVLMSCLTRPEPRLLLAWMPLLACVAAAQLVTWTEANIAGFSWQRLRVRFSAPAARAMTYAAAVVLAGAPMLVSLAIALRSYGKEPPVWLVSLREKLPPDVVPWTDAAAFVAWHLNRPAVLLPHREADLAELEKRTGAPAAIYLSPSLAACSPREVGDWWFWAASPRGVYRGTTVAWNSPKLGLLRLPRTVSVSASDQQQLERLQGLVSRNPRAAEPRVQLALAHLAAGRLREAQQQFQEAVRLDEYSIEALMGLWQTTAQLTHSDTTLQWAKLASRVQTQDGRAAALLEQAAAHFEQLTLEQPNDPWVWLNLMICRSRQGRWKDLEACYQRLSRALPKAFPPGLVLANLYLQQGEPQKAAAECDRLLREQPNMPTAHYLAGQVALAQNNLEQAHQAFEAATRLRPNWVGAHRRAGEVCERLGRHEEALTHYQAALAIAPGQPLLQERLLQAETRLARTNSANPTGAQP